ncbi:MAG: hypothetical protein EOP61_02870, partial [Sphingomonadales bacterium]
MKIVANAGLATLWRACAMLMLLAGQLLRRTGLGPVRSGRAGACGPRFALASGLLLLSPQMAFASAGCDSINTNAAFLGTTYGAGENRGIAPTFAAGDKINFTATITGGGVARLANLNGTTTLFSSSTSGSYSYSFPNSVSGVSFYNSGSNTVTFSAVSCTPAPVVNSLTPSKGSAAGGTLVIIAGSGFSGTASTGAVKFGSADATYIVNSATLITATAPSGSVGTVDVTVTNNGVTSATSANSRFGYNSSPTVTTEFGAPEIAIGGSTTLTITVTNPSTNPSHIGGLIIASSSLNGLTVSSVPANGCGGSVDSSGGNFAYSTPSNGGYIPSGSSCTISLNVTGSQGSYSFTPGAITMKTWPTDAVLLLASAPAPATLAVVAAPPALGLTLASGGTPAQGGNFTLSPTITNSGGTATSGDLTLSSTLPSELQYVGYSGADWNCGGSSGTALNCTFSGTIAAGASNNALTVQVKAVIGSGPSTTPSFTVSGGGAASPASGSTTVTVAPTPTYIQVTGGANQTAYTNTAFAAPFVVNARDGSTQIMPSASVTFTAPASGPSGTFAATGTNSETVTASGGIVTSSVFTANGTVGGYFITVTSGAANGTIEATNVLTPPTISSIGPNAGPIAGGTAITITGTNLNGATAVTIGGAAATGVTVVNATTITATTPSGTAGARNVAVTTPGGTGTLTGGFTYVAPLTVGPSNPSNPTAGTPYSLSLTASGGTAPYQFAITSGAAPTGLTLASDATLSGTPTAAALFNFTVTATDANGITGTHDYELLVQGSRFTLSAPATNGTVGVPYSVTFTGSGGLAPYHSFTNTGGALPAGVTLDGATGILSGTPLQAGTFTPHVVAYDSTSGGIQRGSAYSFTIASGDQTISFTSTAPSNAVSGVGSYMPSATATSGLPVTLTIDGSSSGICTISGGVVSFIGWGTCVINADQAGDSNFNGAQRQQQSFLVRASADNSLSNLTISQGTLSPSFSSVGTSYTASVSNLVTSIDVTPTVNDANATVSVAGNPVTSGNPSAVSLNVGANPINVVVRAQDGGTKTYTVTVTRAGSNDATLSNLTTSVGSLSPSFNSGAAAYSVFVPNASASIQVTPTVNTAGATVTVNGINVTSGSPSPAVALTAGQFQEITVMVTAQNGVATSEYKINALRVNPFTAASTASALRAVGAAYSQANLAAGGLGGYTYTLASGTLPAGTTLDSTTGTVEGVPTVAGSFTYTIRATDSLGSVADGSPMSGIIAKGTQTITFGALPDVQLSSGSVALTATASSALPVTFELSGNPATCTVSGNTV